jgi:hypothetical protein
MVLAASLIEHIGYDVCLFVFQNLAYSLRLHFGVGTDSLAASPLTCTDAVPTTAELSRLPHT